MKDQDWADWFKQVNCIIAARCHGMTADDLPDCPYIRWYDDDISPSTAAARAIKLARSY